MLQFGEEGDRNFVFAIWFTYINGSPVWIVGNTDYPVGSGSIEIPLFFVTGGEIFTAPPGSYSSEDIEVETVGTMLLKAVHCNQVQADFDLRESGLGQRSLSFNRLISVAGYECDQTQ